MGCHEAVRTRIGRKKHIVNSWQTNVRKCNDSKPTTLSTMTPFEIAPTNLSVTNFLCTVFPTNNSVHSPWNVHIKVYELLI
jgi:hypothetical protein